MHEKDKKALMGIIIGFSVFTVLLLWGMVIVTVVSTVNTLKNTGTFESFAEFEAIELENCVSGEGFAGSELVNDRNFFSAERKCLKDAGFFDEDGEDYPRSYGMIWEKDGEKVSLAAYIFTGRADAGWYYTELTDRESAAIATATFTTNVGRVRRYHYAVMHHNTVYHMSSESKELLNEFKEIVNTALLEE